MKKIRDSLRIPYRRIEGWSTTIKPRSISLLKYNKVLDPYNDNILSQKMVFPHHTPYVTPHILHKHYAQAHDHDQYSQCMFSSPRLSLIHLSSSLVIGQDLEYFSQAGFDMDRIQIKRNAPVALLYEDAIRNEGAIISSSGALINFSGKKTGRSPKDKRIVYEETSKDDIWWGSVNIKMDERMFRSVSNPFFSHSHSHNRHL